MLLKTKSPANAAYAACPSCKTNLSLTPDLFGQTIQCPTCQTQFVAPQPKPQFAGSGVIPSAIGWCVYVAALILIAIPGFVEGRLTAGRLSTEQLQAQIQDSIKQKFSESADTRSIRIKKFGLVHENGNKYKGLLELEQDNTAQSVDVDVTYDGNNTIWKIVPSANAGQTQPEE